MRIAYVVVAFLSFVGPQDEAAGRVADLIQKLRSDQIEVREAAAQKLRELGKPATEALKTAVRDQDTELSARARAILAAIADDEKPLRNPNAPFFRKQAPAEFKVKLVTSRGEVVVKVTREWAPKGSDRFYNLVRAGFYDECRFFRVIAGFMCQFGIHGDPAIAAAWKDAKIEDDPVKEGNKRGRISFAMAGPHTRTTQLFINTKDNPFLDGHGFAAFGEVIEGMDAVDAFYSEYGEGAPTGKGPGQQRIQEEGNKYLEKEFQKLDSIKSAKVLE